MIHFEIESTQEPMTQSTQPQYEVQEPIAPVPELPTEEEKKKALVVEALAFIKRAKIEVKRQEPEEKKVSAPVKISLGLAKKQKEPVVTEKPKPKPKQVPEPEPETPKSAESLPSTPPEQQQKTVKKRATRTRKEFELAPNDNFARQFSNYVKIECHNCGEVIPKVDEIQVTLYRVNEEGEINTLTHICSDCVSTDMECSWLKYEPVPITKGSNAKSLYAQRKFPKMTTKHVLTYHGNNEQDVWRILKFLRNIRDEDTEVNLSLKKKKPLFSLPKFFYLPIWNIYATNMTDLISSLGVDPRIEDAYNDMNDFVSRRMRLFQNIIPLEEKPQEKPQEQPKPQEKPQNELENEQESEDEQSQKEFVLEEEEGELNE